MRRGWYIMNRSRGLYSCKTLISVIVMLICLSMSVVLTQSASQDVEKTEVKNKLKLEKTFNIPVLMFHHFKESVSKEYYCTTMTPELFEEHLKALKDNEFETITLDNLYNGNLPEKPVLITMDDGYKSNYSYAYPLLKNYNMNAVIFVVTSKVGDKTPWLPRFTWEEAKEMEESGVIEIACHGLTHINHADLSADELKLSVEKSINDIEQNLGKRKVRAFSYPYGKFSNKTIKILDELDFKIQMTGIGKYTYNKDCVNNINRICIRGDMSGKDLIKAIKRASR